MKNKLPFHKKELDRIAGKVRLFFIVLLFMVVLLYLQGKFFPGGEQGKPLKEIEAFKVSTPTGTSEAPLPIDLMTREKPPFRISFRDADVIFQEAQGEVADEISAITKSQMSHCGLIVTKDGRVFVLEASGNVALTPLAEWVRRGKSEKFALFRARDLTEEKSLLIVKKAMEFIGRPYDSHYEWGDDKLYCSELVYKAYDKGAGIKLAELQPISALEYKGHEDYIKNMLGGELHLDRKVLTPVSIYNSPLMKREYDDFQLRLWK
jgi:hypothetical protein